ncbi:phage major capsid protein [Mangrovicoccus sp. HB161399]|uniref:phage major capsid protein n=1 Tax=Mangrovicoccus sp. HB161399 TaxID=2720392 RepID=UPI001555389D|nr:phage major capsid protein [Mangrovicoccus sp. HB161399]
MTIRFSHHSADILVKKNAQTVLRDLGVRNLSDLESYSMTWADIGKSVNTLRSTASGLIEKITDGVPESRQSEIENTFNVLMEAVNDLEGERDYRNSIGNRDPREHDGTIPPPIGRPDGTAKGVDDGSYSYFGERVRTEEDEILSKLLGPEDRMTTWAQAASPDPYRGLSLGGYLRSMIVGAKTDTERRALAEGSDSAGGYTVPTTLSSQLIDKMRAASVVNAAGARMVPLTSDDHVIARLATDPVPAWRTENSAVTESEPTFDSVPLQPKSLAVLTKISFELMEDSVNLQTELPRIMSVALAKELDRVALIGSGTAPEPRGVANTVGIGTTAHDDAISSYIPLVRARTGILSANAGPVSAIIMHPRDEGAIAEMVDTNGNPLIMPRVLEPIPVLTTTALPIDGGVGTNESSVIVGNFRHLLIGMRTNITVTVLREHFAGNMQYGLLAYMRADVAVSQPGAFHTITGVQG